MKSGDTIIYGNGQRVTVVNLLQVNGRPGVQVDDPKEMFASDRFKYLAETEQLIRQGIWKLEPVGAKEKEL
jgi:hypothetical protein